MSLSSWYFLIFFSSSNFLEVEVGRDIEGQLGFPAMNVMRRLKSIASGRTSISSDPVSSFFFGKEINLFFCVLWAYSLFGCLENGGSGRETKYSYPYHVLVYFGTSKNIVSNLGSSFSVSIRI